MLQAMRSGAKSPLMKFFLLFLAGGFALWGIGDGSTGLIGGSDKAISAGEHSLSPREVAIEFDRTRRVYLPNTCLLYTSPSPRDKRQSRMPSSA